MNSRSSVNESNLVNFSADLSTLNPLDTKESLLSFPFDHIYACHSGTSDRRQTLQLDREVEISTHCIVAQDKDLVSTTAEITRLSERLNVSENQNKKLKDLLIYHLDLIQQQNDLMTKRDKLYQALKQENDTLKSRLNRTEKKVTVNQRQNPPPLVHVPPTTSTVVKSEPCSSSQIMFNSYTELLLPENRSNSYIFNSDINSTKTYEQDPFGLTTNTEPDVTSYFSSDLSISSLLDSNINADNFTMIENKRSFVKKEIKSETRPEPLYTVTTTSGNQVIQKIQKNRRKSSGIGSLSRGRAAPKVPESTKIFEENKKIERTFSVTKKSKMINTYGKSKTSTTTTATIPKRTIHFTGSLSDRLQLIDTTPTGEDPYQLGEADMREQSPIPKLMLQKSNHNRMKKYTDSMGMSTVTSRRIYDSAAPETNTKTTSNFKLDRYHYPSTLANATEIKEETKTSMVEEPDLDLIKTEPDLDWQFYSKPGNETSLCDFSYGENSNNLASNLIPNLDSVDFRELFSDDSPLNMESLSALDFSTAEAEIHIEDKSKKRGARTTSLVGGDGSSEKRGNESKRGRKRALSSTGRAKGVKRENTQKGLTAPKPKSTKSKSASRGKKSPVPGMFTNKPYHTSVGDPDLSWYFGLDPDLKLEDVDPPSDCMISSVEVPRWREMPYTSCFTLEGTENLDDKVFEKRHQKLEAEERRQLRWHMRRIREQRHVERLRLRQRDSWWSANTSQTYHPTVYTIWQQPLRDVHIIEITDTLPVMAFGEILPALPGSDFMLPWVRISKALKRSKRSKTLH